MPRSSRRSAQCSRRPRSMVRGTARYERAWRIEDCVDGLVGWHTTKIGDRWAALEPLRQGVRQVFGRFAKDVARGLRIRCDWGPQYIADAWINEVKWLGMTITPSYVGEPECNGVIERVMRTLKEQCLYLHRC